MADNYEIDVTLEGVFGTGISSVEQTVTSAEPGGTNEITVTLTNGASYVFKVKNGTDGGYPTPITALDQRTDTSKVYIYLGDYLDVFAHLFAHNGTEWKDIGPYGGTPSTKSIMHSYVSTSGSGGLLNDIDLETFLNTVLQGRIDKKLDAPAGGSEGQILTKTATGAEWRTGIDMDDALDGTSQNAVTNRAITTAVETLRRMGTSPIPAATASAMTDTTKIYIYTGTETGYTKGHWYSYDGSAWVDGGAYNTDTTLTVSGAAADAGAVGQEISDLKSAIESTYSYPQNPTLGTGGNMTPNNRLHFDRIQVNAGSKVVLTSSDYSIWCTVYSTATGSTVVEQSSDWEIGAVTHNITSDGYLSISGARANRNLAFDSANDMDGLVYVINPILVDKPNVITYEHLDENLQDAIDSIGEGGGGTTSDYNPLVNSNIYLPELRNGSLGNGGNANSVTTRYILPILHDYDYIDFEFVGDPSKAVDYAFAYGLFKGATDGMTSTAAFTDSSIQHTQVNNLAEDTTTDLHIRIKTADIAEWDHIALFMWRSTNGDYVPLRVPTDQYCFRLVYSYAEELEHAEIDEDATKRKFNAMDTLNRLTNARHTRGATNSPLTLLHFSDPHYDWEAVERILNDGEVYGTNIDEYICTGDMVANVGGSIASWWTPKVLTCIGNHDTASYETETGYNWTALTMAQRDQYYIAPYESNWDVVHTSGTSYYYKDYSSAKVRLIVMDSMLYTENGSEATAQTSWLEGLLSSAITAGLHVLIAIHSPHGGAKAVDCSFSKYGQGEMPTYSDCNTPQTVIDTVATAISGGLHFIGYIVGHTHQDNIWDAEGDGTQLMYCVTCAITKQEAQWRSSDQHRSETQDAYNLVTIDTNNSLIKLIRGGGADSDDRMRARKAICIDYSTGTVISEAQDGNGVYF